MSWQEKPIISGKDVQRTITQEEINALRQEDQDVAEKQKKKERDLENFKRKREARSKGIPFVSVEEEEQKRITEKKDSSKGKVLKIPEIWKSLVEYRLNIMGKIDLEEVAKKAPIVEAHPESIFTNKEIDALYEQAQRILGNKEIDEAYIESLLQDFIHLYNIDEIENDVRLVIEKEERIKHTDTPERARLKKLATILEAILVEGIAKFDWLGKKIKILPPSKFDELYHGVDAIIELARDEEANEFLGLGIDVSYRSAEGDLFEEKVTALLDHIDLAKLTQIKYFKDNQGNAMQDLAVPRVIVSVEGKVAEDLVSAWEKRKEPNGETAFAKHAIAIDIIGQVAEQCKFFSAYARKKGAEEIAEKYDEAFDLLLKISEEVPQARKALTEFKQSKFIDKIQQLIRERNEGRFSSRKNMVA